MTPPRVGGSTVRSTATSPASQPEKAANVARPATPATAGAQAPVRSDLFDSSAASKKALDAGPVLAPGSVRAAITPQVLNGRNADKLYDGAFIAPGALNAQGQRQLLTYPRGTDLSQVPPFEPRGGEHNSETLLYINGIVDDSFSQARSAQALADVSGSRVIALHNATEGRAKDIMQAVHDQIFNGSNNEAVDSLADTLLSEMRAGHDIHIVGHSQGGEIAGSAIKKVQAYLARPELEGGPPASEKQQLQERLSQIKIETFGGAGHDYPPGPQYVHYVNTRDPVQNFGLPLKTDKRDLLAGELASRTAVDRVDLQARAGGPGTVVDFVNDKRGGFLSPANHEFVEGYLHQRVEFEEARRGHFHDVQTKDLPPAGGPQEEYARDGGALIPLEPGR